MATSTLVNRHLVMLFDELFNTDTVNERFNISSILIKDFLRFVMKSDLKPAVEIRRLMQTKAVKRNAPSTSSTSSQNKASTSTTPKPLAFKSLFKPHENPVLRELGTEQVRQTMRAALTIKTYANKDVRVRHIFHNSFNEQNLSCGFFNGASFLQNVLNKGKTPT